MPPLLRPLLEIEQKFLFNPTLVPLFRANLGSPPFRSIVQQPHPAATSTSFRDTYYDGEGGRLGKAGIWLRRREGKGWEVKQRVWGSGRTTTNKGNEDEKNNTYLRSTFVELNSLDAIHGLVRGHLGPDAPGPERNFGLQVLCDFRTEREQATVDEEFEVVLDRTCFGHAVGEVEWIAGRAGMGTDGDNLGEGHRRIDEFMRKYAWFFGGGEGGGKKVKVKLSAYFERFGEGGRGRGH